MTRLRSVFAVVAAIAVARSCPAQTVAVIGQGNQFGYFNLAAPSNSYVRVSSTITNAGAVRAIAYNGIGLYVATLTGVRAPSSAIRTLDPTTATASLPGVGVTDPGNPSGANIDLHGLTFNSGTLYAYNYSSDKTATINLATGTATYLGGSGNSNFVAENPFRGRQAFAGGTLYGTFNTTGSDGLYSFSLTTGAATFLGNGGQAAAYANMLAFSNGGTLYGISGTTLYSIDTSNGSLSSLGSIGGPFVPTSFTAAVVAPVPEPTGILAVLAVAVVGRRRRSHRGGVRE